MEFVSIFLASIKYYSHQYLVLAPIEQETSIACSKPPLNMTI